MKIKSFINFFFCFLLVVPNVCAGASNDELTVEEAILIAKEYAQQHKYDTISVDVEVLRVKNEIEKGPIRIAWLLKKFSPKEIDILLQKEFWIIYFYQKGLMEGEGSLGGGFCVIVDLYTGNVINSFESM